MYADVSCVTEYEDFYLVCLNPSSGFSTQELVSKQSALKCSLKRRHFPVFRESQIPSHGEAGRATALLGLDFIQATGEMVIPLSLSFSDILLQSGTV